MDEFEDSAFILFLNKSDLFRDKIQRVNLKELPNYSDYDGRPYDFEDGIQYLKNKFLRRNLVRDNVFCHVTTATDTTSTGVVFDCCKKVILEQNMDQFT
jgi:GTPase SAR1 family protein